MRIADESVQRGRDAANGEREVVIGSHFPIALEREAEGSGTVWFDTQRGVARGEGIVQPAGGEVEDFDAVRLNGELILVVENPRDVEGNHSGEGK